VELLLGRAVPENAPVFPDLPSFLAALKREGELARIDVLVDKRLEAAEIHRRVIAAGGPALVFTNVLDSDYPLVTNLFGTGKRVQMAFGRRPLALVRRMVEVAERLPPLSPRALWGARDLASQVLRLGTARRRTGPVLDNVEKEVRLDRLPVVTCWPEDGGPFITLPLVYTQHPENGGSNLGIYRLQVHGPRTTGMHWQIAKGGGFHYKVAEDAGRDLPVTVFLGGPPALVLAAIAPLPENVPEVLLASLVAGHKLPTVQGPGPHPLVASAEFALVGRVRPKARAAEGPFGDHYGYYSLAHDYPVFEVETLVRRRDAIYPATVVGKPRQEDFFIADYLQELLSPLFPLVMPGVRKLWSYGETGYHSLASAVVRERYPREALVSAFRILGEGQLALTKFLLVTDSPIELGDFRATLEHVLARTRPETDLYVFSNTSMDTLDYTGPRVNEGSKGVWLGLGEARRELPREFRGTLPQGVTEARVFCGGCLVLGAPPYASEPGAPVRIARHPDFAAWPLLVLTDEPRRAAASSINFLWTTFTRFEPAADLHARATEIARNHLAFSPPVVIDARLKPGFPRELVSDPEVAARVSRRWKEYFPGGMAMGDSDAAHLDPPVPA
jgi:UbiD family decarboxylase